MMYTIYTITQKLKFLEVKRRMIEQFMPFKIPFL